MNNKIDRRTVLKLIGGSIVISILPLGISRLISVEAHDGPLRPPGVLNENRFLSECIRCGACIKVCPTDGLKPATIKYGIQRLGTPVIEGYCKIYCLICIDECPVEALKPVDPDNIKLGNVYIDQRKCILCMKCYNKCPLKAVERDESGSLFIDNDKCKGCNLCKIICPVDAIIIKPTYEQKMR